MGHLVLNGQCSTGETVTSVRWTSQSYVSVCILCHPPPQGKMYTGRFYEELISITTMFYIPCRWSHATGLTREHLTHTRDDPGSLTLATFYAHSRLFKVCQGWQVLAAVRYVSTQGLATSTAHEGITAHKRITTSLGQNENKIWPQHATKSNVATSRHSTTWHDVDSNVHPSTCHTRVDSPAAPCRVSPS